MESMNEDPELASELVALLGKELKAARQRIRQLEAELDSRVENDVDARDDANEALQERAQAAEQAMEVLQRNVDKVNKENATLRDELDELKDSKMWVKKEAPEESALANIQRNESIVSEDRVEEISPATANMKELEAALEMYYAKYKASKESRAALRNSNRALCSEKSTLEEAKADLEATVEKYAQRIEELEAKMPIKVGNENDTHISPAIRDKDVKDPESFMERMPKFSSRPRTNVLKEVCYKAVDLKVYLSSDPKLAECSKNCFYLPEKVNFCRPGKQHALVMGPLWTFDESDSRWREATLFTSLHDQSFSLFFSHKNLIYYAGIYKAVSLRSLNPTGVPIWKSSPDFARHMAEDTIVNRLQTPEAIDKRWRRKKFLVELYRDEVLKCEVLGLQCVGFDQELYASLRSKFDGSRENMGGFFPEAVEPPKKKPKTK